MGRSKRRQRLPGLYCSCSSKRRYTNRGVRVAPRFTFLPSVARHLLTKHLEGNVQRRWRKMTVLNSVRDNFDRQPLCVADGFLASRAVRHHSGEFQRLGDPAAVVFTIEIFTAPVYSPPLLSSGSIGSMRVAYISLYGNERQ
jgi:hypothetical protein